MWQFACGFYSDVQRSLPIAFMTDVLAELFAQESKGKAPLGLKRMVSSSELLDSYKVKHICKCLPDP